MSSGAAGRRRPTDADATVHRNGTAEALARLGFAMSEGSHPVNFGGCAARGG